MRLMRLTMKRKMMMRKKMKRKMTKMAMSLIPWIELLSRNISQRMVLIFQ